MSLIDRRLGVAYGPDELGLVCTQRGVSLAGAPLLEKTDRGLIPRPFDEIDRLAEAAYGASIDPQHFRAGLGVVTDALNRDHTISMSISLAGQNSFQVGKHVTQYAVSPNGAIQPNGGGGNLGLLRAKARRELLEPADANLFATAFAGLTHEAVNDSALLASVLAKEIPFKTEFPKSNLGQQLRMIARLAAATGELGLGDRITTFTASDFGRTWTTNGDGSDHGWGSHHLVMGGAVKGGDIYGKMPDFALDGPDDTGRGRWIPTTSVDEYNATLATWFGVKPTDLPVILPNLSRFPRPDLGFLAPSAS